MAQRIPIEERLRHQRWVGVGLVLGALPVAFILWVLRARAAPSGAVATGLTTAGALVVSGLVLGGLVLLARTDPRWTDQQVVAAYAIVGLLVWLVSALGLSRGTVPGEIGEGLLVAALWPAWLLAVLFARGLGLAGTLP